MEGKCPNRGGGGPKKLKNSLLKIAFYLGTVSRGGGVKSLFLKLPLPPIEGFYQNMYLCIIYCIEKQKFKLLGSGKNNNLERTNELII